MVDPLTSSQKWVAYTISPAAFPDLCLAPNGTENGANLVLAKCDETTTVFKYSDVNGKVKNGKKCVDIRDGVEHNGTLAQVWDCATCNDHQTFDFVSPSNNSIYQLQWTYADYCLDLIEGKGEPGAQVQIWKCLEYNDNQKWIVDPVNATVANNETAPAANASSDDAEETYKRALEQAAAHARRAHKRRSGH